MPVQKILWPTDFSERAQKALPYVNSLTRKYNAAWNCAHRNKHSVTIRDHLVGLPGRRGPRSTRRFAIVLGDDGPFPFHDLYAHLVATVDGRGCPPVELHHEGVAGSNVCVAIGRAN